MIASTPRAKKLHARVIEFAKANPAADAGAIAEQFGYSLSYTQNILRDAGLLKTKKQGVTSDRTLEILAGWVAGKSQADVAREHGVTKQAVAKKIKRASEAGLIEAIRKCDQARIR